MLITKEWLDKTILLNQHGSYQLSPKQMELLHSWYPELFREGAGIDFIKKQATNITEFDEALVSRHIAKITVFEDHFTVDFKSGITIDIEA